MTKSAVDPAPDFARLWAGLLDSPAIQRMIQPEPSRSGERLTPPGEEMLLVRRVLLELLAARKLQSRDACELDEALDRLGQELDINCICAAPDNEQYRDQLAGLLSDLDDAGHSAESAVAFWDAFGAPEPGKPLSGAWQLPAWLIEDLVSLAIPGEPVLLLNWGASTLVPRFLLYWLQSRVGEVEFVTLDRDPLVVENLRLMVSLIVDDLDQVRESIHLYEEGDRSFEGWGFSGQLSLFDTFESRRQLSLFDAFDAGSESQSLYDILSSELRKFGSAIINLQSPAFQNPRYYAELSQSLPALLSEKLTGDGRAVIMGLSGLLDGNAWSKFRASSREHLHIEAIVDFSGIQVFPESAAATSPALILLRHPQQSIIRRVTAFAPAEPYRRGREPDELLDVVIGHVGNGHQALEALVFERPTSELADRWDPKFYCPARQRLQDELISSPQAIWLGGVTQLIERGPPPFVLKPYITTRIAGVTFEGRQEAIAHLKAGDQMWLRQEPDNPHDPNAVHVERRSGTNLGYLPAELAEDVAEAIDVLGGKHPAVVTELRGGTHDQPRGITVQFAPPEYAGQGEAVSVIRPRDITNNRLTGQGEQAWLLSTQRKRVTRLQAGDILLFLRGFGKTCVVPREFEGAVCHRDLAIIRPNEDIDPLYLLSFMVSSEFQEQLRYIARGVTIPSIDLSDLHELLIIVPPLATQRRIALAFAESQGELGPGFRENIRRWLEVVPSDATVEQRWTSSSLLSSLFSDWDQIHTLDDWSRLKGGFVHDLRNSVAHGVTPFRDPAVDASIMALDTFSHVIGRARREPETWASAVQRAEQILAEFVGHVERVDNPSLQSMLSDLATRLGQLLKAQPAPATFDMSLDPTVVPAGTPALIHLSVTNQSDRPVSRLEIAPHLSSGEIVEGTPWRLDGLDPRETHSFQVWVRFDRPETVGIECDILYASEDLGLTRLTTRLTVEVVPAEQVPFAPIQPNPYITGGAVDTPEMFFGRQDVLDFLSANLIGAHQSNVIILQGNRRTGKSSILKQVVNRDLFAPHIPVYVDCQGLGTLTNQSFFYKLAREIWKALAKRGDVAALPRVTRSDFSEDDPFYDFQEVLDQVVAVIPGRRIILLVDEFEVIDAAIQRGDLDAIVLENLRHLFQHRHDLAVVLTGSYRLTRLSQEYWSILFGVGLKHEVGFLDETAVRQLITEPLRGIVTYSDRAVNRIVELTACQPYFVQMVCHDVVNVLNRHETAYVTQLEVEEAAQETLTSADGHMRFMFELADSRAQQAVLVYMASSLSQPGTLAGHEIEEFVDTYRLPMSRAGLEAALRELADRDAVQIEGDMGQRRYGFKIDLFRQWIRRNYDLQSAIALAQSTSYIREGK